MSLRERRVKGSAKMRDGGERLPVRPILDFVDGYIAARASTDGLDAIGDLASGSAAAARAELGLAVRTFGNDRTDDETRAAETNARRLHRWRNIHGRIRKTDSGMVSDLVAESHVAELLARVGRDVCDLAECQPEDDLCRLGGVRCPLRGDFTRNGRRAYGRQPATGRGDCPQCVENVPVGGDGRCLWCNRRTRNAAIEPAVELVETAEAKERRWQELVGAYMAMDDTPPAPAPAPARVKTKRELIEEAIGPVDWDEFERIQVQMRAYLAARNSGRRTATARETLGLDKRQSAAMAAA